MKKRCGLFLFILIGLWAAASPALDTTVYAYRRDVLNPNQADELGAVALDSVFWDVLQAGAADVRIVANDTLPVPYLLRKAIRKEMRVTRVPCGARVDGFELLSGNVAELTLSLASNAPPADHIVFQTPLRDFERELSVWGVEPDGAGDHLLVDDALIYDYSRFVDVRHSSVSLPSNSFRRFRIRMQEVTDTTQSPQYQIERTSEGATEVRRKETSVVASRPFRMDDVRLFHDRETEKKSVERVVDYPVKSWTLVPTDGHRQTLVEIDTFNEPLTSFVIESDSRNFSRRVTVEVCVQEGGRTTWREVGQARITRITFRDIVRQDMTVSFPEQRSRRFRIRIDNGDGVPLSVVGVCGRGSLWQVIFMMEPTARYAVYYGDPHGRIPAYDTEPIRQVLARNYAPVDVRLGVQEDNPEFQRRGTGLRGLLGSRGFFIAVILVMVVVLAFGLIRAGKKVGSLDA